MTENNQTQWADPNPAGNLLVACILIGTGALFAGLVPSACLPLLMVNSIVIGVALFVIAVISFKRGDIMGATLNAVFATIFAVGSSLAGLTQFVLPAFLGFVTKESVTMPLAQIPAHVNGWILLPGAVAMLAMSFIAIRVTWVLVAWFGLFSVALGLASVWIMLGTPGVKDPALPIQNYLANTGGWFFIVCGVSMFYIGLANLINTLHGRVVLPMGSPLIKSPPSAV
jgi:succinate-acetate transporter protein